MTQVAVHTARVRTTINGRRLLISGLLLLVVWEIAAFLVARTFSRPDQVLPHLTEVVSAFKRLSDYWPGGLGIEATEDGGAPTLLGAALALGYGAVVTALRLASGLAIGLAAGIGFGLLVGYIDGLRRFIYMPINLIASLPLLALVPLFAFWFGATTTAAVLFIAFGCGNTVLRGTINAIDNVPTRYLNLGRTLGAGRWQLYRRIIIPAILPELRGSILVALTFSWSLVLSAELIGVQGGLGAMMKRALDFSLVTHMVLVSAVFVLLAAGSVVGFSRLSDRVLAWVA
jgi:sulfonate transport system permease protein